jgi:hypothetical protein
MRFTYSIFIGLLVLILAGCGSGAATPTPNPDLVITSAAMTVQAEITRRAGITPTSPPTEESTPTPLPATQTPTVPEASPTPLSATPVPTSSVMDAANYVSQSIADGTKFKPGESFEVTWVLINAGESTWTPEYKVLFFAGDQMGALASNPMPEEVAPNTTVEITINFTAPTETGRKRSIWVLNNPATGRNFYNFYIDIEVVAGQ